jgi:hypothetical protein
VYSFLAADVVVVAAILKKRKLHEEGDMFFAVPRKHRCKSGVPFADSSPFPAEIPVHRIPFRE